MVRLVKPKTNKNNTSHLNMLICALDPISEVLNNHVCSYDDLLCCGFIQSCLFLRLSAGVGSLFCKCWKQKTLLSDDLYAPLAD